MLGRELRNCIFKGDLGGTVQAIKFKALLEPHAEEFGFREYVACPPPAEIGSITLVDQVVLLCLLDLIQPKEILEIGTYKGFSTRFLLTNSPQESIVKTVDLPSKLAERVEADNLTEALVDGDYNDDFLRREQLLGGERYLKSVAPELLAKLELVKANSVDLDYSTLFGQLEFAFIDGGHDYETVKADTNNVLSTMKRGVILWHDYASGIHSDVTKYLSELAREREIFHVSGSLIAFTLLD
jgi:hypothetical protein